MKALAFNQEKVLVGAFSMIVKSSQTFGNLRLKLYCTVGTQGPVSGVGIMSRQRSSAQH